MSKFGVACIVIAFVIIAFRCILLEIRVRHIYGVLEYLRSIINVNAEALQEDRKVFSDCYDEIAESVDAINERVKELEK